jgi:hypothetical protein
MRLEGALLLAFVIEQLSLPPDSNQTNYHQKSNFLPRHLRVPAPKSAPVHALWAAFSMIHHHLFFTNNHADCFYHEG